MGTRDLSPRHGEFIAGMDWQWVKALCCYCWQTCRRLPVGSKWLGAYQSVPVTFSDCFAREVLEDSPWKWGTLLVPENSWCSRSCCRPGPAPTFVSVGKGCGELPCCCRPNASSRGGSRDSGQDTRALPMDLCSESGDSTDRSRHPVLLLD